MEVLETIVSEGVKKLARRGPDMRLVNKCFRVAASDDERYYARIGAPDYAKRTVAEKAGMYRVSLEVLRTLIDHAARGLLPEEEPLAKTCEDAVSSHDWLATLRKEGSLLRMPSYSENYLEMAAEHRRARIMGEVNSLLRRDGKERVGGQ